jgi:hypothetical protein
MVMVGLGLVARHELVEFLHLVLHQLYFQFHRRDLKNHPSLVSVDARPLWVRVAGHTCDRWKRQTKWMSPFGTLSVPRASACHLSIARWS